MIKLYKLLSVVMLSICIVFYGGCKKKEYMQEGKRIPLGKEFLGINFCTLTAKDIIEMHNKAGMIYKLVDYDKQEEIKFGSDYEKISSLNYGIESKYFIGKGLEQKMIIDVSYTYIPIWDSFHIEVTLKDEYFPILLEQLKKQFGYENAYVNTKGLGEIEWISGEAEDCIDWITITKKLQGGTVPVIEEKGAFFLVIRMSSRIHDHVE